MPPALLPTPVQPFYQDIQSESIPVVEDGKGVSVRVLAGSALGTEVSAQEPLRCTPRQGARLRQQA